MKWQLLWSLCVTPKLIRWILTPKSDVIRSEGLWEVIWDSVIKDSTELPHPFHHGRTLGGRWLWTGRAFTRTWPCWGLDLGLPDLQNCGKKFLWPRTQVFGYSSPNGLRLFHFSLYVSHKNVLCGPVTGNIQGREFWEQSSPSQVNPSQSHHTHTHPSGSGMGRASPAASSACSTTPCFPQPCPRFVKTLFVKFSFFPFECTVS